MARARGEFIFILDADFFPEPDVFLRMLGHFSDAKVGMVQARWEHRNRDESLLTKIQAVALDAHFLIEQVARSRSGRFYPGERVVLAGSRGTPIVVLATGVGMSANGIRPVGEALINHDSPFVRRPKSGGGRAEARSRSPGEMGRAVVETGMM